MESVVHPVGGGLVYKKFVTDGAGSVARTMYNIAKTDPLIGVPKSSVPNLTAITTLYEGAVRDIVPEPTEVDITDAYITRLRPVASDSRDIEEFPYIQNYKGLQDAVIGKVQESYQGVSDVNTEHSTIYPYSGAEFEYYEIVDPAWAASVIGGAPYSASWTHEGMYSYSYDINAPYKRVHSVFIFYRTDPALIETGYIGGNTVIARWMYAIRNRANPLADATSLSASFTNIKGLDRPHMIVKYQLPPSTVEYTIVKDLTDELGTNETDGIRDYLENKGYGYLPILPIRDNWSWLDTTDTEDKTYPLINGKYPAKKQVYRSVKRILKKTAYPLQALLDNMQSSASGNDPATMRSIYYGYFADTATDNKSTLKYLHTYFKNLIPSSTYTKSDWNTWISTYNSRVAQGSESQYAVKYRMHNRDGPYFVIHGYRMYNIEQNEINIKSKGFSLTLLYNYITSTIKTGSIGSIGDVTKEILPAAPIECYEAGVGFRDQRAYENTKNVTKELKGDGTYFLRLQLTANTYEEIEVHGLLHVYMPKWDTAIVRSTVDMARADRDANLDRSVYVPILFGNLDKMSAIEIAEVLADCSGYVIYAQQSEKVEWYKSSEFIRIVKFVVIAISAFFGMPQVGAAIVAGLSVLEIVLNIIITYALKKVAEIVIKELGLEKSFIALVVIAVISIYSPESISMNFGIFEVTASMLLASSIAATNQVINDNMLSIQEETLRHEDLLEEKQKEIDDAVDLLQSPNPEMSYLLINKRPQYILDATPELFYSRTVETIDFPDLSTEFVDSFHSRNLDLDTLYK